LTNFTLCNFRLEPSSHQCQSLPMLDLLVWLFLSLFLSSEIITHTGIYP
jgi:hypothetical protein